MNEDTVIIAEVVVAVVTEGISDLQCMEVTTTNVRVEAAANLPQYG